MSLAKLPDSFYKIYLSDLLSGKLFSIPERKSFSFILAGLLTYSYFSQPSLLSRKWQWVS